jgi:hypothetical protein
MGEELVTCVKYKDGQMILIISSSEGGQYSESCWAPLDKVDAKKVIDVIESTAKELWGESWKTEN